MPEQLSHQQGFPEIKVWMACHLGGAPLSGVVDCMIDSTAPQEPVLALYSDIVLVHEQLSTGGLP
jgi:hypothetical protein